MGERGRTGPKEPRLPWYQCQGDLCISGCQPQNPETGLTYQPSGMITPTGVA